MSVEPWLKGPVTGVPAGLQPAAHAFLNALADLERLVEEGLTDGELRSRPGDAAPIAFHLLHMAGAIDRLLTYADGGQLSDGQKAGLRRETDRQAQDALTVQEAMAIARGAIEGAIGVLRSTNAPALPAPREVGRAKLPSTLGGLLFHAAEHTARHAGQALTTFRIVRGLAVQPEREPANAS